LVLRIATGKHAQRAKLVIRSAGPLRAVIPTQVTGMDSPFKKISDVFQPHYNVNFSIEKPDGSILLTLTDAAGVAVKRFISTSQWRDQQQLERLITSLQFSLAIERGEHASFYQPAKHSTSATQ